MDVCVSAHTTLLQSWEESKPLEDELALQRDHIGTCVAGLKPIIKQRKVWYLGVTQALFESAMFTFVFLWTPALSEHKYRSPLGFIFATFMLAIVLGSTAFQLALELKWTVNRCLDAALVLSVVCFLASFVFDNPSAHFLAFVGFEVCHRVPLTKSSSHFKSPKICRYHVECTIPRSEL